jgi:hypothetical protein
MPQQSVPRFQSVSRFLIPSMGDLIFVLLLILLSTGPLAQKLLGDAGIGWHIRTGELILRTHSVPRVDMFSSTMNGRPWYAWEWLYDALVGAIHHGTGLNGVIFFSALVMVLTFTFVFRRMLARGASLPVALILLLLAVSASTIHFFARPHIISWLFTVVWFAVLEDFEAEGNPRRLYWLPLIMLVWANLHGGFLVGFVLQGIYLVGAWTRKASGPANGNDVLSHMRTLLATGVLMLAATFVNPYGYKLHVHIYRYLSDRFLMDHIDEFLSPNFHGIAQKCFAVLVLLTIFALAAGRKKLGTSQLLVVCFAVYTGLYASRNIPVSSMLLAMVVAALISTAGDQWSAISGHSGMVGRLLIRVQRSGERISATESHLRGHAWPVLLVLVGIWICFHQGRAGSRTVIPAEFDAKRFPVKAVDFLAVHEVYEPVFCPDSWGGYVIYRLYPSTPVVVDDRHDLYGAEFLKNYLKIVRGEESWDQALSELHANRVLVQKSSPLASLLRENPRWKTVYHDGTAVLFQYAP